MPLDAIPDLTPILGYTDDVAVLGVGLATVAVYINKDVREQAPPKVHRLVPGGGGASGRNRRRRVTCQLTLHPRPRPLPTYLILYRSPKYAPECPVPITASQTP